MSQNTEMQNSKGAHNVFPMSNSSRCAGTCFVSLIMTKPGSYLTRKSADYYTSTAKLLYGYYTILHA